MKRKHCAGEILTRDCDLTIEQVQDINAGRYVVYTKNGRVGYDGIRYTTKGRVVLYFKYTLENSSSCERWLIRGAPIFLVPKSEYT